MLVFPLLLAIVALLDPGSGTYNLRGSRARQAWATSSYEEILNLGTTIKKIVGEDKKGKLASTVENNLTKLLENSTELKELRKSIVHFVSCQLDTLSWKTAISVLGSLASSPINSDAKSVLEQYATGVREDIARNALREIAKWKENGIASLEKIVLNKSTHPKVRDEAVAKLKEIAEGEFSKSTSKAMLVKIGREIAHNYQHDSFLRQCSILIIQNALNRSAQKAPAEKNPSSSAPGVPFSINNASSQIDSQSIQKLKLLPPKRP